MFRCLLGMYVAYHMTSDSTKFGGEGIVSMYTILFYLLYCFVCNHHTIGFDYIR
jgi:hypothetical protein